MHVQEPNLTADTCPARRAPPRSPVPPALPLTHMRGECCSLHMCPASRPASTLWVHKYISHCLHLSKSYLYSQDTSQISFQMSNNGVIFKKYKSDRVIFVLKSFNGSDCTSNTTWGPCIRPHLTLSSASPSCTGCAPNTGLQGCGAQAGWLVLGPLLTL